MTHRMPDRVKETTTGTGIGSLTLAGAAPGAFRSFATAGFVNNDTFFGTIAHQNAAEWEVGQYTWTTGGVITRTAGGVLAGSAGVGTLVNFSTGIKDVFVSPPSDQLPLFDNEDALAFPNTINNVIPAVPSSGLKLFVRNRGGRRLLHQIGPSGVDVAFQPALFGNNIVLWQPSSGSAVYTALGTLWTARLAGTGAKSHPAPASTNGYAALKRAEFATGTTAASSAGEQSDLQFWRGNAAGLGGFFFFARFGIGAISGTWCFLCGLSALNAALAGEPSAQANTCGLIKDTTDTDFQLLTRDASTAAKTNAGRTPTANDVLDFMMFAAPNGSDITMRLINAVTGVVYADNIVKTANLPVNTAFMGVHFQLRSTVGTTSKVFGLNRLYCESDV